MIFLNLMRNGAPKIEKVFIINCKIDQEKEKAIAAARNTLKKEKRINLRLTQKDYHQIQIKAIEEGIPYQTLISSLVHKYLNGSLAPRS